MKPRAISAAGAGLAAAFLVVIGVLHNLVGLPSLRRAIERGEIAARLGDPHLVNWAFSGGMLSLLGVIVFMLLPELWRGSRLAWRVSAAIGVFVAAIGLVGYLWVPTQPSVLVFLGFGTLLAGPLLVFQRSFSAG
jgi:hypothetical protein